MVFEDVSVCMCVCVSVWPSAIVVLSDDCGEHTGCEFSYLCVCLSDKLTGISILQEAHI